MKKASVILNSYNRIGPWLEQAILSVATQNYEGPIELIIVDDGSQNQYEILQMGQRFKSVKNMEIKVRLMPHCGNLATRRNDGIDIVTGDYVFLLDDDNAMDPARISTCLDHLEICQECDAVYHLSRYMDPAGNLGDLVNFYRTGEVDLDSILHKRNHIDSGEVCVRASTFRKYGIFDERCIILEDWDLWRRILTFGKMHFIPEMLSYYRSQHPGRRVFSMSMHDQDGLNYILGKKLTDSLKVSFQMPQLDSLTFSQADVCVHVCKALMDGCMMDPAHSDVNLCFAPFRLPSGAKNGKLNATIHIEDPYAHDQNKAWCGNQVDYVLTNDEGCLDSYRAIGRPKVSVMPSMSAYGFRQPSESHDWDVCLVGTPYPERLVFLNELAKFLSPGTRFLLIGPDIQGFTSWNNMTPPYAVSTEKLEPDRVLDICNKSKIVLVLNRKTGFNPVTPSRGFVEAASGSLVLMDSLRPEIARYFNTEKEIAMFNSPQACAYLINSFIAHEKLRREISEAGFKRSHEYTYSNRLRKALQFIQANREGFI